MFYLFLLGKVLLGVYFLISGYRHFSQLKMLTGYTASKKVPFPEFAVILTGVIMFLGGFSIITGFYLTHALGLLIISLIGISFFMHRYWEVSDPMARMGERVNFEKNLALAGALMILLPISLMMPMLFALKF